MPEGLPRLTPSISLQAGTLKVIRVHPLAVVPRRATLGSVGYDLFAVEEVDMAAPLDVFVVSTGVVLEPPPGHFIKIEGRSGLSSKGIVVVAGVVDVDYRGELKIVLVNMLRESYTIKVGDRVAQALCLPYNCPAVREVGEPPSATARGVQGFGSTGR